jgi:hypothetical protein
MAEEDWTRHPSAIALALTESLAINLLLTLVEKRLLSPEEARRMIAEAAQDLRVMAKGTPGAALAETTADRLESIAARFAVAEKPN